MTIINKPSPNYSVGRNGYKPEAVVIHCMDGTLTGTDAWFHNPASQVSAHYGIGKNGEVHRYVEETDTAWHAGRVNAPSWALLKPNVNPNLYTIGIEHEGKPTDVWTPEQKQASAALIKDLCTRWKIPIDRQHIVGHYQIFSGKPFCPAQDKNIIDELIALAQGGTNPLAEGIKKIEEGLALLKQL
jgi:N-acetyl-anhydromuramyl-L-alanine amidase AmpD